MAETGPHVRTPWAALDIAHNDAEAACVHLLWQAADAARGEPFRYSTRDLRRGIISGGAAARLLDDLVKHGLVAVLERGSGTRKSVLQVFDSAERKASATGALPERKASADNAEQIDAFAGFTDTPRAQGERKASATGAPNARAEDQPTSYQPSIEDNMSDKPKKQDPVREVWERWEPKRVEVLSGRTGTLTKSRRQAIHARLQEHDREDVETVIAWWLTSSHERAVYLRTKGFGWDTVLRASKFPGYLDMANASGSRAAGGDNPQPTQRSCEDAFLHLRNLLRGCAPSSEIPQHWLDGMDPLTRHCAETVPTHDIRDGKTIEVYEQQWRPAWQQAQRGAA